MVCGESLGTNGKISTLIQLERLAKHELILVSDADVRVPADFLVNAVAPLRDDETALVNCFYRLANPATAAMRWEAIAVNADFGARYCRPSASSRSTLLSARPCSCAARRWTKSAVSIPWPIASPTITNWVIASPKRAIASPSARSWWNAGMRR
jgi:hypothetical protein